MPYLTRFEYSAGAFVFLRRGEGFRLLILRKDNGEYDIPKGHVESGESPEDAAIREIREETGIRAQLVPHFHADTSYFFRRGNDAVSKHVRIFISLARSGAVRISKEHVGYEWLDIEGFRKKIRFKDTLEVLPGAVDYFKRYARMHDINTEYMHIPNRHRDWDLSRNFVPGDGPLNAQVMLIGQAPGRFEDRQRRPFVGRSGKLLDWMIKSARLKRENVYITSVVQFFPPKNRMPAAKEISLCKRFLSGQIKVIEPRFVILLGNVALNAVLGMRSVHANHGSVIRKDGTTYMITLHPAAALRFKKSKAIMRQDFSKFGRLIAESIKEVNV
ncbi:MAG: NUDIX domain-containing protein [Candidatus Marsarchaeota archaeon]|nr:NUDIX domain-containing protein [Candidatus Marsarchaeota archaeon]